MLGGHPRGDGVDWDSVKKEASQAIEEARQACSFTPSDAVHRRGNFATLARGVSFGGGREVSLTSYIFMRLLSVSFYMTQRPNYRRNSE